MTVKVIGHQWYWNYEYCDIEGLEFDSYIKPLDELDFGEPRLLEVDNRCVLPIDTNIRFAVSSADVIHSWAVPQFGIKIDALRGVLSCMNMSFPFVGVWYGQCSEICGAQHRFMPICVETTTPSLFVHWVKGVMSDIGLLNVTPDPRASLDASSSVNTEEGKSQDLVNGSSEVYSDDIVSFQILDFGSEFEGINGSGSQSIDSDLSSEEGVSSGISLGVLDDKVCATIIFSPY